MTFLEIRFLGLILIFKKYHFLLKLKLIDHHENNHKYVFLDMEHDQNINIKMFRLIFFYSFQLS